MIAIKPRTAKIISKLGNSGMFPYLIILGTAFMG